MGIIFGLVISVISSLFSVYKFRIIVRDRVEKLKEAGIKPSFSRIFFIERTLANHTKLLLLTVFEKEGSLNGRRPASDEDVAQLVRDMQRQLLQMQEQLQQQQQQSQQQQQQQQQEIQQLRQQLLRQQLL